MPTNLETPILNDQTLAINFFNGRLLSGEDLTTEQLANRRAHQLLGQSIGDGVVRGLEVDEAAGVSSIAQPVLLVKSGLAVNRNGNELLLSTDTQIALARPPSNVTGTSLFSDCRPPQGGTYIAGAGVYLLVISPVNMAQGSAPVTGLGNVAASCNSNYRAEAVQFRLIQLSVPTSVFSEANKVRNRVAYGCFAADREATVVQQVFGTPATAPNLIDALRPDRLTPCDVPLCVLYWTATGGIQFVDNSSVRRGLIEPSAAPAGSLWTVVDSLQAEHRARVLHFQEHVEFLRRRGALHSARARDHFEQLPPVGLIPLASVVWPDGIEFTTFFDGIVYKPPTFVEGARLSVILRYAQEFFPVQLSSGELIRLHRVRQNQQILDDSGPAATRPYMLFVTGQAPDFSDAHYNVSHFNYANFW
jgi:hypothetical protein